VWTLGIKMKNLFFSILLFSSLGFAKQKPGYTVGADFGLSGTALVSDLSSNAFGFGVGENWGIHGKMVTGNRWDYTFSIDKVRLKENLYNHPKSDYLQAGSYLRSLEQKFILMLVGIEQTEENGFWELFSGYAFGQDSHMTTELTTSGVTSTTDFTEKTRSYLLFGGGLGFRKPMRENFYLTARMRTFFLLNSTYADTTKTLIPIPLLFSIGAEYNF
jgi:hypothetical protein